MKYEIIIKFIITASILIFLTSCGAGGIEGDISDGKDIVKKMEYALKLAKDQNPLYEEKMQDAENELYAFMAIMRDKYNDEEYQKIDRTLQAEMDKIMQKMMGGY
ncbi:MAG: hypothetical protein KKD38_02620 [Candidatus Delongbacteria bacterium]|nr:hypothetical protein [Candidatus Delongbacteria bacterium]MCG2761009.1 hypothetical protein [Candidatus Delongbacteria bacterium]